jgi:hypothetical protein
VLLNPVLNMAFESYGPGAAVGISYPKQKNGLVAMYMTKNGL